MTVYLDLVMGLNFAVDLLLLLGTNRLTGFPAGAGRCVGAALLGGIYGAAVLLPGFSFLGGTFWRLVFLILMGMVAFGLNSGAGRRTGIFLLLSLALGGIAQGMDRKNIPALLLAAAGVWVLCRVGFGKTAGGQEYVPVSVTRDQCTVTVIALRDTGNSLRDPITGEQILVMGPQAAEKLTGLTPGQLATPLETLMALPGRGLRLVPYRSLGCAGGMLLAKRFPDVRVGQKRTSALVAFAPERIGVGEGYQALAGGML